MNALLANITIIVSAIALCGALAARFMKRELKTRSLMNEYVPRILGPHWMPDFELRNRLVDVGVNPSENDFYGLMNDLCTNGVVEQCHDASAYPGHINRKRSFRLTNNKRR